jgi:hypothetical protein
MCVTLRTAKSSRTRKFTTSRTRLKTMPSIGLQVKVPYGGDATGRNCIE